MAKKIIILDRVGEPSDVAYRVAFWLTVPSTRWAFYVKPEGINPDGTRILFKSQYKDATEIENQDLRDGKVEEYIETCYKPAGAALAQVAAFLESEYTKFQNQMNSFNPYVQYGTYWDGASWTHGGVA